MKLELLKFMKRIILISVLVVGVMGIGFGQMNSVGVRLGEPTGLLYKKYLNYRGAKGTAWELGLGTAASGWNHGYYKNAFRDYERYDGYQYTNHHVSGIAYFQGRYLFNYQVPVHGVYGRFDWYWGLGAVLKVANVKYYYQDNRPPYQMRTDSRTDIDFGPEGILGAEYRFDNDPFILFGEVSLMGEVADHFGARALFGTGARYVF